MLVRLGISDIKIVLRDTGTILKWSAFAFAVPIFFSILFNEGKTTAISYLMIGLIVFLLGLVLKRLFYEERETDLKHAFLTVSLLWLVFTFFAALPFILIQGMSFVDSYFESMSAITTTGLTVMENEIDSTPKSLIFWRSLISWIGGAGIIVLGLIGVFSTYTKTSKLMVAEGREERIRPNLKHTAKEIWIIYIAFTFVGVLLLNFVGLPLFDALNYSMSAISTTGLDISSAGLAAIDNFLVEIIILLLMIAGATNFLVHYLFLKRKQAGAFFKDIEFKTMIALIFLTTLIIAPKMILFYGSQIGGAFNGLFVVISAITEGGFHNTPFTELIKLDDFVKIILVGLMIIGGASASTTGGIKISRFLLFLKSIYWKIKSLVLPRGAFFKREFEGEIVQGSKLQQVNHFILLYFIGIILGVLVLTAQGFPLNNALFEVASAQGNAGLTAGVTNAAMPFASKIMLIINMWIGRLEIIPILAGIGFLLSFRRA